LFGDTISCGFKLAVGHGAAVAVRFEFVGAKTLQSAVVDLIATVLQTDIATDRIDGFKHIRETFGRCPATVFGKIAKSDCGATHD
jgi:hypothetical protein